MNRSTVRISSSMKHGIQIEPISRKQTLLQHDKHSLENSDVSSSCEAGGAYMLYPTQPPGGRFSRDDQASS